MADLAFTGQGQAVDRAKVINAVKETGQKKKNISLTAVNWHKNEGGMVET